MAQVQFREHKVAETRPYSLVGCSSLARQSSLPKLRKQKAQSQHSLCARGPVLWGRAEQGLHWKARVSMDPVAGREKGNTTVSTGLSSAPGHVSRNSSLRMLCRQCAPETAGVVNTVHPIPPLEIHRAQQHVSSQQSLSQETHSVLRVPNSLMHRITVCHIYSTSRWTSGLWNIL